MAVTNQKVLSGGVALEEGDYVGGEYGIKVDGLPENFYEEFYGLVESKVDIGDDSTEGVVRSSAHAVDELVDHTYDLAQELGMDEWKDLDRKRIEGQSKGGSVHISNVCNGEWEGKVAAKCRERAIILQLGLDRIKEDYNLEIEPSYREGIVSEEGRIEGHAWVGLRIDRLMHVADPGFAEVAGYDTVQKFADAEPQYMERAIEGRFSSNQKATIS